MNFSRDFSRVGSTSSADKLCASAKVAETNFLLGGLVSAQCGVIIIMIGGVREEGRGGKGTYGCCSCGTLWKRSDWALDAPGKSPFGGVMRVKVVAARSMQHPITACCDLL